MATAEDVRAEAARNLEVGIPSVEEGNYLEQREVQPTAEDFIEHVRNNTEIHTEDGEAVAISFEGQRYEVGDLYPDQEMEETPDEVTAMYTKEDHALAEYLEEINRDIPDDLSEGELSYIAWDRLGHSALFGDEILEREMGLPEDIQAVMGDNGVVHTMFNPALHGIATHGITHI